MSKSAILFFTQREEWLRMLIKTLPVGFLETNCYIVTDEKTRKCAIIDPGADANSILDYIELNGLTPVAVFLTHGHFDHQVVKMPMSQEDCLRFQVI